MNSHELAKIFLSGKNKTVNASINIQAEKFDKCSDQIINKMFSENVIDVFYCDHMSSIIIHFAKEDGKSFPATRTLSTHTIAKLILKNKLGDVNVVVGTKCSLLIGSNLFEVWDGKYDDHVVLQFELSKAISKSQFLFLKNSKIKIGDKVLITSLLEHTTHFRFSKMEAIVIGICRSSQSNEDAVITFQNSLGFGALYERAFTKI